MDATLLVGLHARELVTVTQPSGQERALHVTPRELARRQHRGLGIRSARVGPVACILTDLPARGTAGTSLEELCVAPHWGVVLGGAIEFHQGGEVHPVATHDAFFMPAGGEAHSVRAHGPAVFAGFVPPRVSALGEPPTDQGAERRREPRPARPIIYRPGQGGLARTDGRVQADVALMGPWVYARATYGRASGFVDAWCDQPHWGLVLEGSLAIEWEDDIELLNPGDLYWCRPGQPGHRFEAADGATTVDFTPRSACRSGVRSAAWRPSLEALQAAEDRLALQI